MNALAAAAADPSADTLAFLEAAVPDGLPPAALVDAVIASERLLAHLHAVQARLLAELGQPGRCGDVTALVDALVAKAGLGRGPDGEVDAAAVQELTVQTAVRVAAAEVAGLVPDHRENSDHPSPTNGHSAARDVVGVGPGPHRCRSSADGL